MFRIRNEIRTKKTITNPGLVTEFEKREKMEDEVIIKITPQERDLLLGSYVINPNLIERLKIAEIKAKQIIVKYSPQELEELVDFAAAEANHAENKNMEKKWDSLYEKLSDVLEDL